LELHLLPLELADLGLDPGDLLLFGRRRGFRFDLRRGRGLRPAGGRDSGREGDAQDEEEWDGSGEFLQSWTP